MKFLAWGFVFAIFLLRYTWVMESNTKQCIYCYLLYAPFQYNDAYNTLICPTFPCQCMPGHENNRTKMYGLNPCPGPGNGVAKRITLFIVLSLIHYMHSDGLKYC